MKAYIQKTVDYTLKRRGETLYAIVDENKNCIDMNGGYWKTQKAAMDRIEQMGLEFVGMLPTVHQNYSHWANFEFAK